MRAYILRALLVKEARLHLADRGGIFLALLLMAATLLLSFFGKTDTANQGLGPDVVRLVYVDHWENNSPWIEHLRRNRPANLRVTFRAAERVPTDRSGVLLYEQGTAAVQVRLNGKDAAGRPRYQIMFWHPGAGPEQLAPFLDWFWKETQRFYQHTPVELDMSPDQLAYCTNKALIEVRPGGAAGTEGQHSKYIFWPNGANSSGVPPLAEWLAKQSPPLPAPVEMEVTRGQLTGRADVRSMIATGLVVFAICFLCVYLLPAMTCEERERGILLAQALSPASTAEILGAKFLFYPVMGIGLGALLAGIYQPAVLTQLFFWLCMVVIAVGYLGVGVTIATLARTQRRASMGALCYFASISLFIVICAQNNIGFLPYLTLEYHAPRMLHAAMLGDVPWYFWGNLATTTVLAIGWTMLAATLFRRRGWQ